VRRRSVRVARLFPAVASDDDVAVPQSDASVGAGAEVTIAAVAGEPLESSRQVDAVALGNASGETDVFSRAVLLRRRRGLSRQRP